MADFIMVGRLSGKFYVVFPNGTTFRSENPDDIPVAVLDGMNEGEPVVWSSSLEMMEYEDPYYDEDGVMWTGNEMIRFFTTMIFEH